MYRTLILTMALVVIVAASSATADQLAYFPFEEGQGATTADVTGNGNDGTFNGDVEWVAGHKGGAVRFDTAGERIVIGAIDPTAGTNAMTLAAWINWEGEGHSIAQQGIIGKRLGWVPPDHPNTKWFWQTNPAGDLTFRNGGAALVWGNGLIAAYPNEWIHVAVTWDNDAGVQYINAVEVESGNITLRDSADDTPVTIGCTDSTNNETFVGTIDEARIYNTALTAEELAQVMLGDFTASSAPKPADTSTDIPQDVVLGWSPGDLAVAHDVYLGTSLEDVGAAERDNPLGVLVSEGQTELTYDPPSLLDFDQTYYWRVDEVNAPPDSAITKGAVWSFTVEPFAYPIENVIATSNGTSGAAEGPENTVNGSGLDADDLHGIDAFDMWLATPTPDEPQWIQYEFDKVYKLQELWVWNYNVQFEMVLGFGVKDVTIEYSTDGVEWTAFGDVEFAKGPAMAGYAHNTTVDLSSVAAKSVRFAVNSGWGMLGQFGLSEVRFSYVPVQAREPQPTVGREDVELRPTLDWRSGREAAAHEVYFSGDRAGVEDGTALVDTVSDSRYQLEVLDYGTTYYWKINEVNDAATPPSWEGAVWNFSTQEYAVLDDMESYDDEDNRIYETWIDGFGVPENGSQVGYLEAPFAEQTIVNSGAQSMPLFYDNTGGVNVSEATKDLGGMNLTANGADSLSLSVSGIAPGFYEDADGTILMNGIGTDIWDAIDEFRFAYKQLTGNGSMIARVDDLDNSPNQWVKAGVMIRQDLAVGSVHSFMPITGGGGNGASWQGRESTNASSVNTDATDTVAPPYWVRIDRSGDTLTGFLSSDGETWTQLGAPRTIAMNDPVLIGLAVTSHNVNQATSAQFSNVSFTGASGAWQIAEVGMAQPEGNDPQPIYVALNNSVVIHPDAAATARSGWTEWVIPLREFGNVSNVGSMTIGVGNPNNGGAGAGLIYVDDILVGHPGSSDPGSGGLLAYYALENDANDSSGNNHDGTVMGEPIDVDGPEGSGMALEFDGAGGQYVDLGTWDPSAATGQLTVSLWARWNGLNGQYQGLIAKRDTWSAADMMWQIEGNIDTGALSFKQEGSSPPSGAPVLPIGEWAHVAATFDGATAKFYVAGEMTGEGGFSFGSDPEAALVFGACQGNGNNPFNGALDEIRLYDRALSAFEIKYLAGK